MKILLKLLFVLSFTHLGRAGYIQTGDLTANFNNIQYLSQIQFPFKLETALTTKGALVLISPFSLGSSGVTAVYQMNYPTQCSINLVWTPVKVLQVTEISFTTYMFNFDTQLNLDTWYTIRINLESKLSILSSSESLYQTKPFSVYTQTDFINSKYGIMIDDNQVLGTLTVLPSLIPTPNTVSVLAISLQYPNVANALQKLKVADSWQQIEITFQATYVNSGRVLIEFDEDFLVTSINACKFVENNDLQSVVPALGSYTCEAYQDDYRKLLVTLKNEQFNIGLLYTLQFFVQNPAYITTGNGFTLYILQHDANTILEAFTKTNVFATQAIAFKDLSAEFSWGYGVQNLVDGDFAYPIAIYKDITSTTHRVYNTFQFIFGVTEDAASDVKLAIKLQISPGTPILQSLTENLPNYSDDEKVYCYLENTYNIICTNIGKLLISDTYQIGVKVNFDNTVSSLGTDFGKLTGYTWKESLQNYDFSNPYIIANTNETLPETFNQITTSSGYLVENKALVNQNAVNGYQGLHTSVAINTDMTGDYGVKYRSDQNAQFLRVLLALDDNDIFGTLGAFTQNQGIEMYLNERIFQTKFDQTPICGIGQIPCDSSNCTTCNAKMNTTSNEFHLRIWANDTLATSYFTDNTGSALREISFSNIEVRQPSSLQADQ